MPDNKCDGKCESTRGPNFPMPLMMSTPTAIFILSLSLFAVEALRLLIRFLLVHFNHLLSSSEGITSLSMFTSYLGHA